MKKGFIVLLVIGFIIAISGTALGDIEPREYLSDGNWSYYELGAVMGSGSTGFDTSTHDYGTWNSPYILGVDGYNYNDPQAYVETGGQFDRGTQPGTALNADLTDNVYAAGPHGGYLTSTHRCRECHAVHRAAGKFKLTRSDTRFEACDWCHGTGAGSGFNIQMDNDDAYTMEYNVGHSMGFGVSEGKWKAPDDTYPAYTPNYWEGGFSCFDCHSPHANPQRILGFNNAGEPVGLPYNGMVFGIANPGHDVLATDGTAYTNTANNNAKEAIYLSGSWILIKNPDREVASKATTVPSGITGEAGVAIAIGAEIPDIVTAGLNEFDALTTYPVNKIPTDWNVPVGVADGTEPSIGYDTRNTAKKVWSITEFCTDCHDGNAGLHTVKAPLFSEDRALRNQGNDTLGNPINNFRGNYDLAYGHDSQPRQCARQMKFNPEDSYNFGPQCRNCHRGSSACGTCHGGGTLTTSVIDAASSLYKLSTYNPNLTSTGAANPVTQANPILKESRTVTWSDMWRTSETTLSASCSDDGLSWPHRTLAWKMLKDDLFGIDVVGGETVVVAAGQTRQYTGTTTHDLDSVCLDCHNPTVWNATSPSHVDDPTNASDDYNDELLLRGLP